MTFTNLSTALTLSNVESVYIPPPSEIGRAEYYSAYRKRTQLYRAVRQALALGIDVTDLFMLGYADMPKMRSVIRDRIGAARKGRGRTANSVSSPVAQP
jgi:hypothetical protein